MGNIKLEFVGPFGWSENRGVPNIFDSPLATETGVYLWTVQTRNGDELVFYIGQTGVGFGERFKEHYQSQSDGSYRIYNPATFILGQKELLWGGIYGDYKEPPEDFQNRFARVKPIVPRFLEILRFHLAPISAVQASGMQPIEFLNRVEAALAYAFYFQPGIVSALLEGDVQYLEKSRLGTRRLRNLEWPPPDATTRILITSQTKIRGLPEEVLV